MNELMLCVHSSRGSQEPSYSQGRLELQLLFLFFWFSFGRTFSHTYQISNMSRSVYMISQLRKKLGNGRLVRRQEVQPISGSNRLTVGGAATSPVVWALLTGFLRHPLAGQPRHHIPCLPALVPFSSADGNRCRRSPAAARAKWQLSEHGVDRFVVPCWVLSFLQSLGCIESDSSNRSLTEMGDVLWQAAKKPHRFLNNSIYVPCPNSLHKINYTCTDTF